MARIAILADVHGNLPALEAVIEDLAAQQVDEVLVGGDLVGRGPQGSAVVERIAGLGWRSVRGNHEDYLLDFRRGEVPADWLRDEEWAASRWMVAELSDAAVSWIERLPFDLASEAAPGLRLVHGTPDSNRQGIGPWSSERTVVRHWDAVAEPVLVVAHTHRPLVRHLPSGLVANVGSVGLPFNRDRRAQYAIFGAPEAPGDRWEVELRQVDYPEEAIRTAYEETGFLDAGGITARLLMLELEHAAPFLVPFLEWARAAGGRAAGSRLFLEVYDPGEPLGLFFEKLERLAAGR